MNRLIVFFLFLISFSLYATEKPVVAVFYFKINANITEFDYLSEAICEMFITDLSQSEEITVVEREKLEKILKEQKLSISDFTDETNAIKVGRLINADRIVIGSLTVIETKFRLDARLLDVETGKVIAAEKSQCSSKHYIFDMVDETALRIIRKVSGELPAQIVSGPRMDVLFLLDSTGSMADEIETVKEKIEEIAKDISYGNPKPDVRFGIVTYRDRGDAYVTRKYKLTRNLNEVLTNLSLITASGGGDYEESLNEALKVALCDMNWDEDRKTSKSLFLIADAPPHMDYGEEFTYKEAILKARESSISINSIGCSGLDGRGGKIFKEISKQTNASFNYLTYKHTIIAESGERKEILEEGKEIYEVESTFAEELEDEDWEKGVASVARKPEIKTIKTSSDEMESMVATAKKSEKKNNLGTLIVDGIKSAAEKVGVKYETRKISKYVVESEGKFFNISTEDPSSVKKLDEAMKHNRQIWIGGTVQVDGKKPAGFSFEKGSVIVVDSPPKLSRKKVSDISKNPEYYKKHGLMTPNRWMILAKPIKKK